MKPETFEVIKQPRDQRVPYRLKTERGEFALVRSAARPHRMMVLNEKLRSDRVAGFRWFTDAGGQLRGVA